MYVYIYTFHTCPHVRKQKRYVLRYHNQIEITLRVINLNQFADILVQPT